MSTFGVEKGAAFDSLQWVALAVAAVAAVAAFAAVAAVAVVKAC